MRDGSAKPEGTHTSSVLPACGPWLGLCRDLQKRGWVGQRRLCVRLGKMEVGRYAAVVKSQGSLYKSCDAGRRFGVTDVGFHGSQKALGSRCSAFCQDFRKSIDF